MILRGIDGDVELRDLFSGVDRIPRPGETSGAWSFSGRTVNFESASGLPAVMDCIRIISETAASLPLEVFQNIDGKDTAADRYSDQQILLGREPNEHATAFQVWAHTFGAMLGFGNAFIVKSKDGAGKVVALYPLDPSRVTPRVESGELIFYVRNGDQPNDPKGTRLTRDDILHVPGLLLGDPYIGVSPISVHRHSLGTALAQQEYAGRFYANDGTPGGVISVQGQLTKEKREEIREAWESRHRGSTAAHRVAVLTGGATFDTVGGANLKEAQYIEGQESSVREICRAFGVPANWLDATAFHTTSTPEEDMSRFVLRLTPWLRRLEAALESDKDLFPDADLIPGESAPCVRFDTNHLARANQQSRFTAYTAARQGGWMSANEIRAQENLPPVDGGDQVQVTPVGGAVNPDAAPAAAETPA